MLSLIMPSFGNARFIEESISSVLSQSVADWELIIVDDASPDDSNARVMRFLEDDRIRLLENQENLGIARSITNGVEASSGAVWARLDPDDVLHPRAIEIMLWAHREWPGQSIIYSTHYECDEELNVRGLAPWVGPVVDNLEDDGVSQFATMSREMFDRTEGLDADLKAAVDKDLYFKLEEMGPTLFVPLPLLYYRMHPASVSQGPALSVSRLYHARAFERAIARRRAKGAATPSRRVAARRLGRLGYEGLVGDRTWALEVLRKAVLLDPLNWRNLKAYTAAKLGVSRSGRNA